MTKGVNIGWQQQIEMKRCCNLNAKGPHAKDLNAKEKEAKMSATPIYYMMYYALYYTIVRHVTIKQ